MVILAFGAMSERSGFGTHLNCFADGGFHGMCYWKSVVVEQTVSRVALVSYVKCTSEVQVDGHRRSAISAQVPSVHELLTPW